jgi:hypothetical protein
MKRTLAIEDTQDTQDTQSLDTRYVQYIREKSVTQEERDRQDELAKKYRITLLPKSLIRCLVNFLGYCDARSLNQTCKQLHQFVLYEGIPHKCVPPSTPKLTDYDLDLERLKSGELERSEVLILDEISPNSELINLILDYCLELKHLCIKCSCRSNVLILDFGKFPYVETSIKIKVLDSVMEDFTAHIFDIEMPGEYKRTIDLNISNLENLKSL